MPPDPDLVKIDVEGSEVAVLNGAMETVRRARPVIFLATYGDELLAQCRNWLTCAGYGVEMLARDELVARPNP